MKLNINDIEEQAKELVYDEVTESLNGLLVHGSVCDFEFRDPAVVRVSYYRAGEELFFHGRIASTVIGHCGRCLDEYSFPLSTEFSTVLVPPQLLQGRDAELGGDIDLAAYESEQIDLSPLVHERIILALPTRPLCRDSCKGLCAQCGANLNTETCACRTGEGDPRLAVLRTLKLN